MVSRPFPKSNILHLRRKWRSLGHDAWLGSAEPQQTNGTIRLVAVRSRCLTLGCHRLPIPGALCTWHTVQNRCILTSGWCSCWCACCLESEEAGFEKKRRAGEAGACIIARLTKRSSGVGWSEGCLSDIDGRLTMLWLLDRCRNADSDQ